MRKRRTSGLPVKGVAIALGLLGGAWLLKAIAGEVPAMRRYLRIERM